MRMSHSISIRQREILEGIRLNGFLTSREIDDSGQVATLPLISPWTHWIGH